jgi:UDP-galactopyranose mutase
MDILCFSHLRWNFVFQRPQHLLSRFAQNQRVFYFEEAEFPESIDADQMETIQQEVTVVKTKLTGTPDASDLTERQKKLLTDFLKKQAINDYALWYYTPMALPFTEALRPSLTVYDCMDELSAFKGAPPALKTLEQKLMRKADIVFTGGHSLYQAKKNQHGNIHPFPSSIEKAHFAKARQDGPDPDDQASIIPHPRFGFYGVIDERFDIDLIDRVARKRPDWQFVLIGPVVKIDPATLPKHANIHYLGGKSYQELPAYLRGWDIAIIPFMLNEATRFISPTKTPEYLAGGKPVISNAIRDVVNPYGNRNLVHICNDSDDFIRKAEMELARTDKSAWLAEVDNFLANNSWDATWQRMTELMNKSMPEQRFAATGV